ncbi:MAG: MFS transporter [Nonomuraea sp.]|nr:MFS transporter [Nonomuraea sp.]
MAETTLPASAVTSIRWRLIIPLFLIITLDGYDTISLGLAVPALAKAWGVAPAAFTLPLVLTNAGVVVGYLACGRLVPRYGARNVIAAGTLLFAVATALTALTSTIPVLSVVRLITGVGLGLALPTAITLATQEAPERRRQTVAVFVAMGLSAGATIGGLTGRFIVPLGWQAIFWVGAVIPLVLIPLLLTVKVTPRPGTAQAPSVAGSLFRDGNTVRTALLWAFAFLIFTTYYAFNSWLPTLLLDYGFTPALAPLGATALGVGGIVGGLLLIMLSLRMPVTRILTWSSLLAAVLALLAGSGLIGGEAPLLVVFGGVACGLIAGMTGQAALAVSLYPPASRTTAVGYAAAVGRVGSVIGPAVGGALIAAGQGAQTFVLVAVVPVLVAGGVVALLGRRN